MSNLVSENGQLTLPLYHGTSSYFWPSIKRHGLGGTNIAQSWRLVPMLKEAAEVLTSIRNEDIENEMRIRLPILKPIVEQRVSGGGFNFRHGGVYLTCSPARAVLYATRGFGSELLGQAAETIDLLVSVCPEEAANLLARYPEAAAARSAEHRPVLIEIERIHIDRLRAENGDAPDHTLAVAQSFMAIPSAGPPQVTFELAGIVRPDEISASEIEVTDWGYGFPRVWEGKRLT
jgi:hypothetical protein